MRVIWKKEGLLEITFGGSLQISSWTTNKGMNFFKGNDRLLIKFCLSCI